MVFVLWSSIRHFFIRYYFFIIIDETDQHKPFTKEAKYKTGLKQSSYLGSGHKWGLKVVDFVHK